MPGLLAVLVVVWALREFVTHVQYAAKGQLPPRTQERLARIEHGADSGRQFGTPGRERYGFRDLAADSWFDGCQRLRERQVARRQANAAATDGSDVVDRVEAAPSRFGWFAESAKRVGRVLIEPVGEKRPTPPAVVDGDVAATPDATAAPEQPAAEPVAPVRPRYGDRYTDDLNGRVMQWDGGAWRPVCPRCDAPADANDYRGWLICSGCGTRAADFVPRTSQDSTDTNQSESTPTTGGTTMEATNYESTVAALDQLAKATADLTDHVAGAVNAANQVNDHISEVDEARQRVAEALALVQEQLAAKGVAASAVGQVQNAMEMIHAGDLNAAMDYVDAAKNALSSSQAAAAEASGGVQAAQDDVVATYGDAHATMAAHGTDGSFIDGGGGASVAGAQTVSSTSSGGE